MLALDVEVALADGTRRIETVRLDDPTEVFRIDTPARPVGVRIDPDHRLLLWRETCGPRPGDDWTPSRPVPDDVVDAVVGSYRFRGMEKDVEVFFEEGELWVHPAGSAPVRLLYQGGGTFHVDAPGVPMVAEFDLETRPAQSFVSIEGGGAERYPADRVR